MELQLSEYSLRPIVEKTDTVRMPIDNAEVKYDQLPYAMSYVVNPGNNQEAGRGY